MAPPRHIRNNPTGLAGAWSRSYTPALSLRKSDPSKEITGHLPELLHLRQALETIGALDRQVDDSR